MGGQEHEQSGPEASSPSPAGDAGGAPADGERRSGVEGVVKWFDPKKGFGFILGPDGQDVFVHFSAIKGEGYRVLKDGSTVVYDAVRSAKGWKATAVAPAEHPEVTVVPRRGYTRTPRR